MKAATLTTASFISSSEFQSTPPVKAATEQRTQGKALCEISIHAAREGGDGKLFAKFQKILPFQSTPPVKAATRLLQHLEHFLKFQSTPPVKAATCLLCVLSVLCYISIHAAREGGDGAKAKTP